MKLPVSSFNTKRKTQQKQEPKGQTTLRKIKNLWPSALLRGPGISIWDFCPFSTSETDDAGTSVKFHVHRTILPMFPKQASHNFKLMILNTLYTRTSEERDGSRFLKKHILKVYHILWHTHMNGRPLSLNIFKVKSKFSNTGWALQKIGAVKLWLKVRL